MYFPKCSLDFELDLMFFKINTDSFEPHDILDEQYMESNVREQSYILISQPNIR